MRKEVLDLLAQSKVAEMKEDAAFADGALAVAESFYLNRNKYPYMIFYEKKAFDQWRQKYLNAKATVAIDRYPGPAECPNYGIPTTMPMNNADRELPL